MNVLINCTAFDHLTNCDTAHLCKERPVQNNSKFSQLPMLSPVIIYLYFTALSACRCHLTLYRCIVTIVRCVLYSLLLSDFCFVSVIALRPWESRREQPHGSAPLSARVVLLLLSAPPQPSAVLGWSCDGMGVCGCAR